MNLILSMACLYLLLRNIELLKQNRFVAEERLRIEKNWRTQTKWLENISQGKKVADFLKANQYASIAIYGFGYMGKFLLQEIKNDVDVRYIIDRNSDIKVSSNIPIIKPDDIVYKEEVELIIITPITYYDEIFCNLYDLGCDLDKMISLEDLLWSL